MQGICTDIHVSTITNIVDWKKQWAFNWQTSILLLLLPSHFSRVRLCATPWTAAHQASRPWDSPVKNTGVGCHFLLQCRKVKSKREVAQSCPTLATPWTAAHQAPPSMGFSRQKYWSGVPLPSPNCTWLSEIKTKLSSFCCVTEHILMIFTWKQCIIPLRMSRIFFSLFYSSLKGNCEGWSGSSHIRS